MSTEPQTDQTATPETATHAEIIPIDGAPDGQIVTKSKTDGMPPNPASIDLLNRTVSFIAPWTPRNKYPGRERTILRALDRGTMVQVTHWRVGRRPFPRWAALAFEAYIRAWITRATALADELAYHASVTEDHDRARNLRGRGFGVIGPDGRDKRGRWRAR